MPRLGLLNMGIGFAILSIVAAAGAFIATDITSAYLSDAKALETWQLMLTKSAHGHMNLFGIIHIIFGLTLPYSTMSRHIKKYQSIGIGLGSTAMGPVLVVRAYLGPSAKIDMVEAMIGIFLVCALLSIASHSVGIFLRLLKRSC